MLMRRDEDQPLCPCCGQELPPHRNCAYCGREFSYGPRTGKRKTAQFCSDKCRKLQWLFNHGFRKGREIVLD
jgi:predicted nucleic acid-binding Zn ribbon protein